MIFPAGQQWGDLILELVGSGVMGTAVLFFALISHFFRSAAYRAMSLVCAGTLLYTAISGISRLTHMVTGNMGAAFEIFRVRELVAVGYLSILPAFLAAVIKGPSLLTRFNTSMAKLSLMAFPLIIVLAYAFPALFLFKPYAGASGGVTASMGFLYWATQAAIGLQLFYGIVLVLVDRVRWRSFGNSWAIPVGMVSCGYLAISDIVREFTGFYADPLFFIPFSRTVLGEVLLSSFLAFGFSRIFLRQAQEVSRSRDELERTQGRLRSMLYTDDLTGLPNRRKFLADLRVAMEGGGRADVVLMDLDSFMEFNECFGNEPGDMILREVSREVPALLPSGAGFYRMGGDEFSLILPEEGSHEESSALSLALARSLRDRVSQGFLVEGKLHSFGLAMSIARVPNDGDSPEEVLSNAYSALNEAKKDRNSICDYSDVLKREALVRISTVQRLRESLRKGAFHMVYQPIFDASGRVASAEALLRWAPEDDGQAVSPALFIPLLESSGLMPEMGSLIIKLILEDLGVWMAGPEPFPVISVNLSPHQLRAEGLGLSLLSSFSAAGVPPGRLQFEVTESAFLERASVAVENLSWLRDRGCAIAVDDFGTGYSNLGYLRSLPIDKLKIDQSFVRPVPGDAAAEGLLGAMADIGRNFGLALLAEGVETEAQRDFLAAAGYGEFQGFLFSRPLPRDAFLRFLASEGRRAATAS